MKLGLVGSLENVFLNNLARTPAATNFFTEGVFPRAREKALAYRNIQLNKITEIGALSFDIDSPNGLYNFYDNNCIAPNIVTINPENNHAHYIYLLKAPVYITENARKKPIELLRAIDRGMTEKLHADRYYNKRLTKNPLHPDWTTYSIEEKAYSLDDLADNFDLIWSKKQELEADDQGRNVALFNELRFWAYKQVDRYRGNYEAFHSAVFAMAAKLNTDLLPEPEVRYLSKSVAHWTYRYFKGDGKNRGVMNLAARGHNLTDNDRRVLGAKYSHQVRKEATERKIIEAKSTLQRQNKRVSIRAVATCSGLSKTTVQKYKSLL